MTLKEIKKISAHTREELIGTFQTIDQELGYFMRSEANWSYRCGWTRDGDLVVTVFGEVVRV